MMCSGGPTGNTLHVCVQEDVLSNRQLCKQIRDGLSQLQGKLDQGYHMADILELQKTVTMEKEKVG